MLALEPSGNRCDVGFETSEGDTSTVAEDHRLTIAKFERVDKDFA
jgi:hypothetical protein